MPQDLRGRLTFVNLTPYGTNYLADGPGEPNDDNNLDRVPRGIHKLGDTYFRIGDTMVHVRGTNKAGMPMSVKGIRVGAKARGFISSTAPSSRPRSGRNSAIMSSTTPTDRRKRSRSSTGRA